MLAEEIIGAQRFVRTDAYQMSIGEIVSMYDTKEIIVDPEFQRLFRWKIGQKSKLIESLLLGIPVPSIFVFEKDDGKWELVDGLQRISTILEFMGRLRSPDGCQQQPSILEATKYLPSLHNVVWEFSEAILEVPVADQVPLDKVHQLAIRRARIGVEILKRPTDDATKFELFQRLNAGGTQANAQELRNCVMLMVNGDYFRAVKTAAERSSFKSVTAINEDQIEKQRHMEFAVRFLVHTFIPYDGKLDVEEYVDEGIVHLAEKGDIAGTVRVMSETFDLLNSIAGGDTLRRFEAGRHAGKIGLVGIEGIAVGVAKNIEAISTLPDPRSFVSEKIQGFWSQPETANFTSLGLRGTTRIQRTVPFGERWFKP
ncbi:MAG: DUF262 domain-containing protein [Methylocystis sp.]